MVRDENSPQASGIGNIGASDNLRYQLIASVLTQCQNGISSVFDQEVSQYLLLTKNAVTFLEVNALVFWKQHICNFCYWQKLLVFN